MLKVTQNTIKVQDTLHGGVKLSLSKSVYDKLYFTSPEITTEIGSYKTLRYTIRLVRSVSQ